MKQLPPIKGEGVKLRFEKRRRSCETNSKNKDSDDDQFFDIGAFYNEKSKSSMKKSLRKIEER